MCEIKRKDLQVQGGAISLGFDNIFESLNSLECILQDIERLIFIPRPVDCDSEKIKSSEEIVTVSMQLGRVNEKIRGLTRKTVEISEAIGSQLDSKIRLV
jgi:hypothetical protein